MLQSSIGIVAPEGDDRAHADVIRVASVPRGHVYVRHLYPDDDLPELPHIERLADPDPAEPGRAAQSVWWPPPMLDAAWVRGRADFDLMHLQFGFDARTPAELQDWVGALRETGRPLVYTVHDLRNPHHADRSEHDAQLDVLIPAADAVITLTPGAAAEIRDRWGRESHVLPHPHVVDFTTMERIAAVPRSPADGFRVGVHVKSLRANMDPLPVIRTLQAEVTRLPGAVLQVDGHNDVLLPDGARYDAPLADHLYRAAADGEIDLRIHDYFDDAALWDYLSSLDVSVLPYRFGTHSGWLEACSDLGTAVLAPTCGYYAEQGEVYSYEHDEHGLDPSSLIQAVSEAFDSGRPRPLSVDFRRAQRRDVARAHARIYQDLLT